MDMNTRKRNRQLEQEQWENRSPYGRNPRDAHAKTYYELKRRKEEEKHKKEVEDLEENLNTRVLVGLKVFPEVLVGDVSPENIWRDGLIQTSDGEFVFDARYFYAGKMSLGNDVPFISTHKQIADVVLSKIRPELLAQIATLETDSEVIYSPMFGSSSVARVNFRLEDNDFVYVTFVDDNADPRV